MEDYDRFYGKIDYGGKIVLDVGCDWGSTVKFFLDRGAKTVIGVECDIGLYNKLVENASKWGNTVAIHLCISRKEDWRNLILSHNPDVVKSDCEGCEATLIDVETEVLTRVNTYVLGVHSANLIERFKKFFPSLAYELSHVDAWAGDAETIIYAVKK